MRIHPLPLGAHASAHVVRGVWKMSCTSYSTALCTLTCVLSPVLIYSVRMTLMQCMYAASHVC